jgi:hypothetical protein
LIVHRGPLAGRDCERSRPQITRLAIILGPIDSGVPSDVVKARVTEFKKRQVRETS